MMLWVCNYLIYYNLISLLLSGFRVVLTTDGIKMWARGFILLLTNAFISIYIVAILVAHPSSSFHGNEFFLCFLHSLLFFNSLYATSLPCHCPTWQLSPTVLISHSIVHPPWNMFLNFPSLIYKRLIVISAAK